MKTKTEQILQEMDDIVVGLIIVIGIVGLIAIAFKGIWYIHIINPGNGIAINVSFLSFAYKKENRKCLLISVM